MATFGTDAHYAYRIQMSGSEPITLTTEPAACTGGCGKHCCQAIDQTGHRVPVHVLASTPITVLAAPGGRRG
jgi:hypothetical protein